MFNNGLNTGGYLYGNFKWVSPLTTPSSLTLSSTMGPTESTLSFANNNILASNDSVLIGDAGYGIYLAGTIPLIADIYGVTLIGESAHSQRDDLWRRSLQWR